LADTESPDRRSSPRRAADWRVLFGPPDDLSIGYLADMSPIGVSILTEKQYSAGTEVEVHFGIQDDQASGKLRMRAVIRHCAKGRLGVQFLNVNPTEREHWWKIMRGEF
jgi:c-di-GMP-binding flagellar brake protein YcgR